MYAAVPILAGMAFFATMPDAPAPYLMPPTVATAVPAATDPPAKVPAAGAAAKPAPPAPKPAIPINLPPLFTDDPNKLAKALSLNSGQLAKLKDLRARRDEALTRLIENDTRRINLMKDRVAGMKTGAERARADIAIAEKQHQATVISQNSSHERDMFAVLTPEQRSKHNAPLLSAEVAREYKPLNITDDQIKQITALCEVRAREMTAPVDLKLHEGILKGLKAQTFSGVLTPEQRRQQIQATAKKPTK
jgi:Spy/CpxP family protein refolding chaperone